MGTAALLTAGASAPRFAFAALPSLGEGPASSSHPPVVAQANYSAAGAAGASLFFIAFDANGAAASTRFSEQEESPSFAPLKTEVIADVRGASVLVAGVSMERAAAASDVGAPMDEEAPVGRESVEAALFDLANADREENGLPRLEPAPWLLGIARQRAVDQVGQPSLNHYLSDGGLAVVALLRANAVPFQLAGENLARHQGSEAELVAGVESALMGSPTHRANILEPTFEYLAVGSTLDDRGNTVLVQIFLRGVA